MRSAGRVRVKVVNECDVFLMFWTHNKLLCLINLLYIIHFYETSDRRCCLNWKWLFHWECSLTFTCNLKVLCEIPTDVSPWTEWLCGKPIIIIITGTSTKWQVTDFRKRYTVTHATLLMKVFNASCGNSSCMRWYKRGMIPGDCLTCRCGSDIKIRAGSGWMENLRSKIKGVKGDL